MFCEVYNDFDIVMICIEILQKNTEARNSIYVLMQLLQTELEGQAPPGAGLESK